MNLAEGDESQLAGIGFSPPQPLEIGELDVPETLDGGQAFRWHLGDGGVYRGVIGNEVVQVSSCEGDVWVSSLGDGTAELVTELCRDYIASGKDPRRMLEQFSGEPWVSEKLLKRKPLRVLRQDPWECLAAFICSQNSNMPRIKKMVASVAGFGADLTGAGDHYIFPEAGMVADLGEARLRELGLGYRASPLIETARTVAASRNWLSELRAATYEDAKRDLMELPGVGPKVADCVLAYSLDKLEAFPIDVHVMRAMMRLYGLPDDIKLSYVGSWARDRFGEWSSLAQLYIFRDEVNRRSKGAKETSG